MSCKIKLILGTVQFGLDYGINNQSGKVSQAEVDAILNMAYRNGISTLDTSSAYGDSEVALGNSLKRQTLDFKIISKYPRSTGSVEKSFRGSLLQLERQHLYGYLIHHFDFFKSHPDMWDSMRLLKMQGCVQKIGFSLYSIEQLLYLIDNQFEFDLLQFPYNLFDRQFEPYLWDLKQRGVEIHTRSVFLQGLFFKDISSLSKKLLPLKPYLEDLYQYCRNQEISIESLALNYVILNPNIDGVLIGVDNVGQLQSNINTLSNTINKNAIDFVNSIQVKETELLNPVNWN